MNDLPQGWTNAVLRDAIQQLRTGPFGSAVHKSDYVIGGTPLINPMHINEGEIQPSQDMTVGPVKAAALRDYQLQTGDVIIGRRGEMGRCAVIQSEQAKWLIGTGSMALTPSIALDSRFLQKFLSSVGVVATLEGNAIGSTMVNLNQSILLNLSCRLPPLPEQRRIVAKIDSIAGKSRCARDHLDHIPRLVEKYKQAILAAAFRGDLTRGIKDKGVAVRGNDGIDVRASHLSELPFGWAWASIGGVGQVTGGLTKNAARKSLPKQVPYLRVSNVYANELRLADIAYIGCTEAEYLRTLLRGGDLLVVEGNGSIDQIGRVAIWSDEVPGCSHQNHLIRVRLDGVVLPEFALYWLLSPGGRTAIEAVASSSSGLHTLSMSKVKGLPIPVCSAVEQSEIVCRIKSAFSWVERLSFDATNSRKLVDHLDQSVLAKAFKGELVPQDPADEPASILLERIRAERAAVPRAKRGRKKTA